MRNVKSTLTYKWFEDIWNNGDEHAIDRLVSPGAKVHGIADQHLSGPEGFKTFYRDFKSQFHDIKMTVEDVVAQDDFEAARTTVNAIHTESNKPVTFTGMCMARIADGQVQEAWNNYDFLTMYQHLGQSLAPTA